MSKQKKAQRHFTFLRIYVVGCSVCTNEKTQRESSANITTNCISI